MLKKLHLFQWILTFILIASCGLFADRGMAVAAQSTKAVSQSSVFVAVNDTLVTYNAVNPVIHNGTLYVPLVETGKMMNVSVQYANGNLAITHQGNTIKLSTKDKAVLVKQGKSLVSLRLLSEKFGFQISYISSESMYRAFNGAAQLNDSQLADKYRDYIKQHLQKPSTSQGTSGKGDKPIYITFDDGPTPHTLSLLKVLDQYNVKATFFMLGNQISSHPTAVQSIVKGGHGLGLHGMTHQKNKFYASPASALNEMNQDNERLHKAAGVYTKLIRTPYGSKPYFTQKYRDLTAAWGYHVWDWNIDSNDWRYKSNPQTIYNNVLRDVNNMNKKGVTPIVLFHDQEATISILPKLIKALQAEGYTFKPITNDMTPVNFWNDKR